ncbi:SIMPL domain-containing protein [Oceanisphaera marina]|uniref:SIMPL domain-containing protein n=1 Tax=Oceanisphaera marina TaxID=2017550 RepID=A0ABQ1IU21_9GAMM|nr:SIMPL domain-containing protein [Oceanisphaera marina]GGB52492.1 SIMPL domain-containing protein [Oceanisphaera marina]
MNKNDIAPALVLGATLAIGLVWSGSYLKDAVQLWKQADRVVSVKGLAEQEVAADLVLWPVSFSVSADSLADLYQVIDTDRNKIRTFLKQAGFNDEELSFAAPVVQDLWANQYGEQRPPSRYKADAVLLVRSQQVDLVKTTQPESAQLVSQGVLLTQSYEHKIQYIFTRLNEIKPQMIADATANARQAAAQFAKDADAEVGAIRSAQQGYFSVSDLDSYTPEVKQVRVVTSVEYSLD